MNNEFKKLTYNDQTVYVLENATSGGTSSGAVASNTVAVGGVQRRKPKDSIIVQGYKDKIPVSTPRNFVAKNAKTSGAGAHKKPSPSIPRHDKHKNKPVDMSEDHSTATAGWGQGAYASGSSSKWNGAGRDDSVHETPIEMDPLDPMNPMIYGHGSNPAKLNYRMTRAAGQLKDLAQRAQNASPVEWESIARQFSELTMNIEQIRHGIDELAKKRKKGGVGSRGIDPHIGEEGVAEGELDEAHHGSLLNPKKGQFASVIFRSEWDTNPQIDYYDNLDDAKFETENASAYHGSVYAWNGARWVRKMSATERYGSSGGYGSYGSWEENKQGVAEEWSQKYKKSINCSHPKGFSQKAHCAGKKKHNEDMSMEAVCPDCGMCETHGSLNEIKKGAKDSNGYTKCRTGWHADGTKPSPTDGKPVRNCVANEDVEEGLKSKIAGAALAAANLLGSPAQAAEEPVKPITIAYVQIEGEVRKYNLGDKFSSSKEAEKFISGVLDKQGLSGYTLDIKHGYPKKKEGVDEGEKKGLYYYVNKRKKAGTSRDASHPKAPTAQAWKDAAKTAKKESVSVDEYMTNLESKLAEKLLANTPVDVWIKDFEKSNAPQFKGKSKEKRREMAIAASYGAKNPRKKK